MVALAMLSSLATPPSVLAAPPRLVIAPSIGVPGATLKATANDFPEGTIHFTWDGSLALGTAESDGQRAVLNFKIPSGAKPGEHLVRACGRAPCTASDPQGEGRVTVTAVSTPTGQAPTTAPPTSAPTPRITPKPPPGTPRAPTPAPTPRPPGSTPGPSVVPAASAGSAGPSPSVVGPIPATAGGPTPTLLPAGPSAPPVVLSGGPASEMDSLASRMIVPLALIGALILGGFMAAKRKRPSPAPESADVTTGAMEAGAGVADPLAVARPKEAQPTDEADTLVLTSEATGPSDAPADPWANARTIAVHVEEIEPLED